MGKLAGKSLNVLMVYQASMSQVHCPFPYSVFTMYWIRKLEFAPSVSMGGDEGKWVVDLRIWPMAKVPCRRETL